MKICVKKIWLDADHLVLDCNSDFFSDAFDTGRPLFVAERYAGGRS